MPWRPIPEPTKADLGDLHRSMKKARFLVDENLGEGVADIVRGKGFNVQFVADAGLRRHDDSDVFAYAWRTDRLLLTHDDGFLNDRKYPPHRNRGIVVLPGGSGETEPLYRALWWALSIVGTYSDNCVFTKIRISPEGEWTVGAWDKAVGRHRVTRYRIPKNGRVLEWIDAD
jgi:hypothetical protein